MSTEPQQQLLSALAAIEIALKSLRNQELLHARAIRILEQVDLSLLHEHDAQLLADVVRLLASIFLPNGKSLLGGSPPVAWSPRGIAQRTDENLNLYDAEVRKPLVDSLKELLDTSKDVSMGVFPTEAHLNARKKAVSLLAKVKERQ